MEAIEVNLPGGVAVAEQWCRSAWLYPVTGQVEEFLLQAGRRMLPAARVTHLLARCLHQLGPVTPVQPDLVRQLSVGDREALLLHLRRITLGDRISCLLACPKCGEKMDLDLMVDELLLPAYPEGQKFHTVSVREGERAYRVVFRLPNGDDQESAALLSAHSMEAATELMLRRCIESVTDERGEELKDIPPVVFANLPDKMAALDPQAEITLDLACPECQASFAASFDPADHVCQELATGEEDFYREVHALSFHYHWNEIAILALTRRKRRIYLELLSSELKGGSGA